MARKALISLSLDLLISACLCSIMVRVRSIDWLSKCGVLGLEDFLRRKLILALNLFPPFFLTHRNHKSILIIPKAAAEPITAPATCPGFPDDVGFEVFDGMLVFVPVCTSDFVLFIIEEPVTNIRLGDVVELEDNDEDGVLDTLRVLVIVTVLKTVDVPVVVVVSVPPRPDISV